MTDLNLTAAWTGIVLGILGGAALGLFFQREDWLGGYGSWRRRLLRLGHISLFGLAFLNLAFAVTAERSGWRADAGHGIGLASVLFVAGAALMPTVCGLAAWRKPLRRLFPLPVLCLASASGIVAWNLARPLVERGAP